MKSKVTVELDWTASPPGLVVRIAHSIEHFWGIIQWRGTHWRVGFMPISLDHHDINWDENSRDCELEDTLAAVAAAMDEFIVEYELE